MRVLGVILPPVPPLVSVLLPYRDAGSTVEQALDSVLAQRGVDLEVLAIDDGSRDDGPVRVSRLAARDRRVIPLVSVGSGIVSALNTGLEAARGVFIARMDADDVSLPDRFVRQIRLLERDVSLAVVGTQVEGFPSEALGEGLRRYIAWQNGLLTPEAHARDLFIESPLCHPSVLLRRDVLQRVGSWREVPWPEDYDLWLRLDLHGWRMAKVPEVLFRWRHRAGRATFRDPRYALERFREAKGCFLSPRLRARQRPVAMWGAGPTGKRLARALERYGVTVECFVDIDPRRSGAQLAEHPSSHRKLSVWGPTPSSWQSVPEALGRSFVGTCARGASSKAKITSVLHDGVRC